MKEAWTLLKTQIRMVAWPGLVLLASVASIVFLPENPLSTVAMLATLGSAVLAGPILFGLEYQEGARDYLATRPASPRIVFGWKVLSLAALALVCGFTLNYALVKYDMMRGDYSWALPIFGVVLSFSLWSAAIAVLTRDTVRGVLFGMVSFAVPIFVAYQAKLHLFSTTFRELPWNFDKIRLLPQNELFWHGAVILSPLVVVALLAWVHEWQARKRFSIPYSTVIAFSLYGVYLGFSLWALHNDGRMSVYPWPGPMPVLGKAVEGNKLLYVGRLPKRYMLFELDIENPRGESAPVCVLGATWIGEPQVEYQNAYIKGNRVLLAGYGPQGRRLDLYERQEGQAKPVAISSVMKKDKSVISVQDLSEGRLAICYGARSATEEHRRETSWSVLDITTGEMADLPCSATPYRPPLVILTGARRYRFVETRKRYLNAYQIAVENANSPCHTVPLGIISLPVWIESLNVAFDEKQVAVITLTDSLRRRRDLQLNLQLYDTTDPSNVTVTPVRIPWRFLGAYESTRQVFHRLGIRPRQKRPEPHLTLGGGFLCLESLQRVAVWDVHEPAKPKLLGIVPTPCGWGYPIMTDANPAFSSCWWPGSTTPIERSDGALGFARQNYGLLWLELPERMREHLR